MVKKMEQRLEGAMKAWVKTMLPLLGETEIEIVTTGNSTEVFQKDRNRTII